MANLIDSGLVRIQAFAELVMGFLSKLGGKTRPVE